ncbi:MAG: flagellar export chaperone FliS [Nitrosomonadales bacterium]|nr:flagellar export chaperone FliS [Nitrosomonadales bacterium]
MNSARAISAYNNVGIDSGVAGSSPCDLIIMLYKASVESITKAKKLMIQKDIAGKGAAISRAISLIGNGLQASLNLDTGGEIAQNLHDLYGYMIQRLLEANIHNDMERLDEVERLLSDLQGAWEGLKRPMPPSYPTAATSRAATQAYGSI